MTQSKNPTRRPPSGGHRGRTTHGAKRRRNASVRGSGFVQNLISTALPSLGVGAGGGAAALKLVEMTKASPAAVAGLMAAIGGVGSALAKKGGMVSTGASSLAAVGAGLTVVDWMQKPAGARPQQPAQHPQQPQQHGLPIAQRQAELVTREELDDAVRELKELRNAIGMRRELAEPQRPQNWMPMREQFAEPARPQYAEPFRPQYDPSPFYEEPMRRDADTVLEEVMHEGQRNAEAWHDVDEWRNAEPVIDEVVHGEPMRNADGRPLVEEWHNAAAGEAA